MNDWVALWISAILAMPGGAQRIDPEPATLHFGAVVNASAVTATPPQTIFLETDPGQGLSWRVSAIAPWLDIQPATGVTPGAIRVALRTDRLPADGGLLESSVTLTTVSGPVLIPVSVAVTPGGQPPIGAVDLPADHMRAAPGPIRFSGWALDDVGVVRIEICRESVPGTEAYPRCAPAGAQLASAAPNTGARPDVAAIHRQLPHAERGGWTVVLDATDWPRPQLGTFHVQVVARDREGHSAVIGTRSLTIDPAEAPPREWPVVRLAVLTTLAFASLILHVLLRRQFRGRTASATPPHAAAADPISSFEWLIIGAIVALAGTLALRPAGGLGYDEIYTFTHFVGRLPPWGAASALGVGVFNNHVAYSWLASAAVSLSGAGDLTVRMPAALLGALTVFALWYFTRTFATRSAALLAALLLAVSPMHGAWSHAARGYTGLALMTVVSSAAFFRLLERPSRGAAIVHATAAAAAIYFHLYGIWVAAIQYLLFAGMALSRRISPAAFRALWLSFVVAGALVALLYVPVLVLLLDIMGGTAARARTAIQPGFPLDLLDALSGSTSAGTRGIVALLLVWGLVRLRHRALHASYVVLLLCVPLLAVWLLLRPSDLYPRFFHFWTPAACMLMAVAVTGVSAARWTAPRLAASIAAGVLLVVTVVRWIPQVVPPNADNGYRGALTSVRDEARRTRTLLIGPDADLLRYYLDAAPPIVDSSAEIDQMMRDDPAPLLVLAHKPGWQSAEHERMDALLSRRCLSSQQGSVVTYRCALAGAR